MSLDASSSFSDDSSAIRVLSSLRIYGLEAAKLQLHNEFLAGSSGPLLNELFLRFSGAFSPRILLDGIWFSNSSGGIARVWSQILDTFSIPGIITSCSPIAIICRSTSSPHYGPFEYISGSTIHPTDYGKFFLLSQENASFVDTWSADIFCSPWITTTNFVTPSCPEIALVHDCIPERLSSNDLLLSLRKRWVEGASAHLAVSRDTSSDISYFYNIGHQSSAWCHIAPSCHFCGSFFPSLDHFWSEYISFSGLHSPFILLPGSGLSNTYKNPELIGSILCDPALSNISLLITGINSSQVRESLCNRFPNLKSRVFAAGFLDHELSYAYSKALAVVIPSLIEGFGLPAVEVMKSGGIPLISNVRGLREAGGTSALRFDPNNPSTLKELLLLLSDADSRFWLASILNMKYKSRLKLLHPDLIGLSLLALARMHTISRRTSC